MKESENKNDTQEKKDYRVTSSLTIPPDSHKVVIKQLVVESKEKPRDDMRNSFEDFHVFTEGSKRLNTSKSTVIRNVFTHLSEDSKCEVCKLKKTVRPSRSEERPSSSSMKKVDDTLAKNHKVLSEQNESRLQYRYVVVEQDL